MESQFTVSREKGDKVVDGFFFNIHEQQLFFSIEKVKGQKELVSLSC